MSALSTHTNRELCVCFIFCSTLSGIVHFSQKPFKIFTGSLSSFLHSLSLCLSPSPFAFKNDVKIVRVANENIFVKSVRVS